MNQIEDASKELFKRRHFDQEIIILCIRWCLSYKLSYRDLKEIMAERGIDLAQTTIMRWVQQYVPTFAKHWQRHARPVGTSWRVDETYIKIKGKWAYLYRGVDREGQTLDCYVSKQRDIAAAKRFLQQAIEKRGIPQKITLDGYAASQEAVAELQEDHVLPAQLIVRTNRYLNNLIEQDHRRIKQRVRPMRGFKRFDDAGVTRAGMALIHQIKKKQFALSALCPASTRTPQIWEAVLAA